jgi:hypothetical protein
VKSCGIEMKLNFALLILDSEKLFWKEHYDEFGRKFFENDVVKWR